MAKDMIWFSLASGVSAGLKLLGSSEVVFLTFAMLSPAFKYVSMHLDAICKNLWGLSTDGW